VRVAAGAAPGAHACQLRLARENCCVLSPGGSTRAASSSFALKNAASRQTLLAFSSVCWHGVAYPSALCQPSMNNRAMLSFCGAGLSCWRQRSVPVGALRGDARGAVRQSGRTDAW